MQIISDDIFKEFLEILFNCSKKQNLRLFIVGGAVRDYYLNSAIKDFDLILEGNAVEFIDFLPEIITVKSIHKDFGTVKLNYKDRIFDLASTRKESYPYSGCLPVVDEVGVNITTDVLRRDFTVNSMYFEVSDNLELKLIDLVSGLSDLKGKKLKVLHDKSYIDDPTRILRGLTYKYRFGFDFSKTDYELIKSYLNNIDYSNMSKDRVLSVFKKSLEYPFGFDLFKEIMLKGYYKILTDRAINVDFEDIKNIILKFDLSESDFALLCEKIILSSETVDISNISFLDSFKILSKLSDTDLAYLFYKSHDDTVNKFLKCRHIKLNASGSDLIELGYKEGRLIGEILDVILNYRLSNPETTMSLEDELNFAKSKFPLN